MTKAMSCLSTILRRIRCVPCVAEKSMKKSKSRFARSVISDPYFIILSREYSPFVISGHY